MLGGEWCDTNLHITTNFSRMGISEPPQSFYVSFLCKEDGTPSLAFLQRLLRVVRDGTEHGNACL
jgi:hypothetical protein